MKLVRLTAAIALLVVLSACQPQVRPSTQQMENDMAAARAGLFGKCMEEIDLAADTLDDAQAAYTFISKAHVPLSNSYHMRGEKLAANAAAQRKVAEEACNTYITEMFGVNPKLALKGQIFFDTNSTQISADQKQQLQQIVASIKTTPAQEVRIVGHTDTTGPRDFNQALSTKRAASVFSTLKQKAQGASVVLPPERIEIVGAGKVDGPTNVENRKDRRVDIYVAQKRMG